MSDVTILVPLAGMSLGAFALWMGHVRKMASIKAKAPPRDPQEARRVEALEKRVRVLEQIVTDGSYDTARQIEALRDAPPQLPPQNAPAADGRAQRDKAKIEA